MAGLSKFRPGFRHKTTEDDIASAQPAKLDTIATEKKAPVTTSEENHDTHEIIAEALSKLPIQDAQRGVQDVEAVTLTWSKQSLIAVFILYA